MKKWEYDVESFVTHLHDSRTIEKFDEWGENGWEITGVDARDGVTCVILKREKKRQSSRPKSMRQS
ncbi:MAG: hypothetical protein HY979_01770 [Candidatus Magasanikbacteria bacterium]|nr:hypothetical protein [Candidatus Magasanikbacteria bacterium]